MSADIDAVIAALQMVLHEAETRTRTHSWKTHVVNKWISQLPGAWFGRWRNLTLKATYVSTSEASREDLITHVRATLAYLQSNRDAIAARQWRSLRKGELASTKPKEPTVQDAGQRPKWLN